VLVATRGRPELVREAITSIVEQTYPGDIECLVIHDQEPPDPSLEALGRPGCQVTVLASRSTGLAGARNSGLDAASAQFIATCDDDDSWHPRKLELQIERLLAEPDLLLVGSGIRLRLPNGKVSEWPGRADRIDRSLLLRNRVKELHSSTLVMRRDAFAKAGRYDEELPNGYAEDYDWVLRASRVGRIGIVRAPLADIRKDVQSYYTGQSENTIVALRHFLAKHPEIAASRRGHARMLGQLAFHLSAVGRREEAVRTLGKALWRWPLSPYIYVALVQLVTGVHPQQIRRAVRLLGRGMA
jgi:glycosyltransferase involved in cell wall biosynthesis